MLYAKTWRSFCLKISKSPAPSQTRGFRRGGAIENPDPPFRMDRGIASYAASGSAPDSTDPLMVTFPLQGVTVASLKEATRLLASF